MKYCIWLVGCLFTYSVYATVIFKHNDTLAFKAKKGNSICEYKFGTTIQISIINVQRKVKGTLVSVTKDSIYIMPYKPEKDITAIALHDINAVKKIHEKGRRGWQFMLGVILIFTLLGIFFAKANNLLGIIFWGVPAVALFTFFPFLIISFLSDALSKKSIKNGWTFTSF